jgi:hypothetical protein
MVISPEVLARALVDEIRSRNESGPDGYYLFTEGDLTDVGLDGRDDLVAICAGALKRLEASG